MHMNEIALKKQLLSFPGETIQEHIEAIGMSQAELAKRMGRSVVKLNELIRGKAPLTPDTAQKLEYILDVPSSFWLNLEAIYRSELLEIEKMKKQQEANEWLKNFPISYLKKINILPDSNKKPELLDALLKFFRVAGHKEWANIYENSPLIFKIASQYSTNPYAISVWLRLGEIQAEKIELAEFNKKKITESIPLLQTISFRHEHNWLEQLQDSCASFGVALVYTPCIEKTPIYGASRWIKNNTVPLIQLTDRHKDYNSFWFSFYHELAHIRFHNKSDIFLSGIENIKQNEEKENEADNFAKKMLISDSKWNIIQKGFDHTTNKILSLSQELFIHPSILISNLQRKEIIPYNNPSYNKLKLKVKFEDHKDITHL